MGARHLRGYAELDRAQPGSLRLRAVCDPRLDAAERLATQAEALLGYRPSRFGSAPEALARDTRIEAADVCTEPASHAEVVIPLLESGVHVQVEKPLAASIRDGAGMVAENYRRDPMNRLVRHVIQSGAIGRIRFISHISVSAGRHVLVTPWRHGWRQGGLMVDMGVHYADMLEYLCGLIETVYALKQKCRETREWRLDGGNAQEVPVECDDCYSALLTFRSGAQGVWVMDLGSAGERQWERTVHGTAGAVSGPPDRSGQAVRLQKGEETLEGEALVKAFPEFRLNGIEAALFGERPAAYQMDFDEIDRKLIAVETADFLDAARTGRTPEVSAEEGLRALAVSLAALESAHAGTPVRVDDVLRGKIADFQEWMEER